MPQANSVIPATLLTPSGISWDDLVLPDQTIQSLREFVLWVTHRDQVEHKWGGKLTSGPVALFSGPSGTGKTLAAEVLASVLGQNLCVVDPGLLVSRYLGESEKRLDALLDAFEREPTVLLFDEADSLFGKRSEINDTHEKYANLEVNYLLSKLERAKVPCVITNSSMENVDRTPLRRFQFVIDFPVPDAAERLRLWHLYLPGKAPIDSDVDTKNLAKEFELTGGQIRNAALHAAFLAAGDSSSINRKHLLKAIKAEHVKSESK